MSEDERVVLCVCDNKFSGLSRLFIRRIVTPECVLCVFTLASTRYIGTHTLCESGLDSVCKCVMLCVGL